MCLMHYNGNNRRNSKYAIESLFIATVIWETVKNPFAVVDMLDRSFNNMFMFIKDFGGTEGFDMHKLLPKKKETFVEINEEE